MSDKLLPCPFCGTSAKWFKTGRDIGIECGDGFDCPGRAQTNVYDPEHRETVIAEWNRRVLPTGEDIRDLAADDELDRSRRAIHGDMVLVPREPTNEMYLAACAAYTDWHNRCLYPESYDEPLTKTSWTHIDVYLSMLAAAPTAAAPADGADGEAV